MHTVSDRILKGSQNIWEEFYSHPFVTGIADGTLPVEKFQFFMIQDYLYLRDYARVFSVGVAKAKDPELMRVFSGYVAQIRNGEMDIHRSYMARLGISLKEAENAAQSLDNLSYTSYMLRVAYEEGPAEICAAILPCAVSYEKIARRMLEENPACAEHEFYGEWVRGYACQEYHNENEELKAITEGSAERYSEEQIEHLVEIGRRCSRYEKNFWDMSWEMRR